ncbi:MAG: hypothetical protein WCH61_07250, partial [bacterium]
MPRFLRNWTTPLRVAAALLAAGLLAAPWAGAFTLTISPDATVYAGKGDGTITLNYKDVLGNSATSTFLASVGTVVTTPTSASAAVLTATTYPASDFFYEWGGDAPVNTFATVYPF